MAKKPKIQKAAGDVLEVAAGTIEKPPAVFEWPENTEERELPVLLTAEETALKGADLVDMMQRVKAKQAEKSEKIGIFKAEIEALEEKVNGLGEIVSTRTERRIVGCRWEYQVNGVDSEGVHVPHSSMKTLFRLDTNEPIEQKPISQEELQMQLPLHEEEKLSANLQKLDSDGWQIEEASDGATHGEAFEMVHVTGRRYALIGDSKAAAAENAVLKLQLGSAPIQPESEAVAH